MSEKRRDNRILRETNISAQMGGIGSITLTRTEKRTCAHMNFDDAKEELHRVANS